MKILKWIGIVAAVLIVLFVVVGLCLPGRYHVERSVVIDAQPEDIFPSINTLKEWPKWSAWTVEKYPDLKITYAGPESGVGAIDEFEGKSVGGHGKFEITKSDPPKGIEYSLDFDHGTYVSTGSFILEPTSGGTKVTWTIEGDLGFSPISRYFGLCMDGMMGPDFETGLANLKRKVEAEAKAAAEKSAAEPASEEAPPAAEVPGENQGGTAPGGQT